MAGRGDSVGVSERGWAAAGNSVGVSEWGWPAVGNSVGVSERGCAAVGRVGPAVTTEPASVGGSCRWSASESVIASIWQSPH